MKGGKLMSNIIREIKEVFDEFKKNSTPRPICVSLPFSPKYQMWVYYFLFPELLIVYDEWAEEYKKFNLTSCNGEAIIFPCWVLLEEEVLRVMAESGIL